MGKQIDFETSLHKLEEIVSRLETGDLSLDDSIHLFEEGMKLSAECRTILEKAKQKITTLTEQGEGLSEDE